MLDDDDKLLMDRLFGPELPEEFLPKTQPIKAVDWKGGDGEHAVAILIQNFIHLGAGGHVPIGWSLQAVGDSHTLSVRSVKTEALAA